MKTFNNLEEMKPYFNEKTKTYEFVENGELLDIAITFDLTASGDITAGDIIAGDINARNIDARDIDACDINAEDIKAWDINAWNITASNIDVWDIIALDINARDINARDINAWNISFYGECSADKNIVCKSIKGRRENSKYFTLDGEVIIKEDKK